MKRTVLLSLILLALLLGGCVSADAGANANVPLQAYDSENGYTLDIPETWLKGEETGNQVAFGNEDNSIALTISSELGGVDYYSLEEIMEQLTDALTAQLFSDYEITADKNSASSYIRIVDGSDAEGAHLVAVLYINQPYQTIRQYLLFVASGSAYTQNAELINKIIASFSTTLDEDQYLQLMTARRAAEQAAEEEEEAPDDSFTQKEKE